MIEIKNVIKRFNEKIVLEDLNLTIPKGSIFGLIGINGAGKSTLMRLLATIYKPDSGEIFVDNQNIFESKKNKKKIFFLPDEPYYTLNSTVKSLIDLYKNFYEEFDINKIYYYMNKFSIDTNKKIITYSKGMRRRLFICIALSCNVEYILLDEAFDGLDPIARLDFKEMITDIYEENDEITVILSSHSLKDLDDIIDSFAIINDKKIISCGNTNEQIEQYIKYQLVFKETKNKADFILLNPINIYLNNKIVEVVFKKDDNSHYLNELKKMNPIIIEQMPISFEDFFSVIVRERKYFK